jgi:uncharacterized protein (DUF1697 family)
MTYIALLRGINVGGNNIVPMAKLKLTFERQGFESVKTYINSGNIIFAATKTACLDLCHQIEQAIEAEFGFRVAVLVIDSGSLQQVAAAIPDSWTTDKLMRCDALFLWPEIDDASILDQLPLRAGVDEARYVPGAVIWRFDRSNATRSGLGKLIGTKYYKLITIRNSNTVRKLASMV